MPRIHPSASVDPRAEIGRDVAIGPYCVVGPNVRIGDGCELLPMVTVVGRSKLGRENRLFPHAVVGTVPQDLKYRGEETWCVIGDRNTIREGVTINIGTEAGGGQTTVGDDNLLMAYCHVAHDCTLGNGIILANSVLLGGHIVVEDQAVIGGNAALQHYTVVGTAAFVGGMSRVVHDAPPFLISEGNPARPRAVNRVKLERMGLDASRIEALWDAYKWLYRGRHEFRSGLRALESREDLTPEVRRLIAFLRATEQGRLGRAREVLRAHEKVPPPAASPRR